MSYIIITSKELDKQIKGSIFGIKKIESQETKIIWYFHNQRYLNKAVKVLAETFEYVFVPSEV